ncbi:MAG: ABC transporter substrate-binding protein [Acidisphaera sp.]|nr:ABC transporter substrate-binding protein [Acidisphaera sp.]
MHTSRRSLLIGATAALAAPSLRARAATRISFRLDWTVYGTHAPFYLAVQEKMFEKAGLEVTIGEGQGSATVAKLVGQGGDPLGFVDFGSMIFAVAAGVPLIALQRVIANNMCIVSHADAPIRSPKELEGKVIAYAPSESTSQMTVALLRQNGVDPQQVSVLNPATGAKNALFLQNRADAIPASLNVQPAQLEAQGAKIYDFLFSDFGVHLMNNGIVANADWAHANPDPARAFLQVTAEAFAAAKADPEHAIAAVIAQAPQQARYKEVLLRQLNFSFPLLGTKATEGKPFGTMAAEDWNETQGLLLKYAGLSKETPVERLYTNDLLSS